MPHRQIHNSKLVDRKPTRVPVLRNISCIDVGDFFSACVDLDGHLWVFGDNSTGQLGLGDTIERRSPQLVPGIEHALSVSCGGNFTFCVTSHNVIFGFGSNRYGQLGMGTFNPEYDIPYVVPVEESIKQISCGGSHTVFLCETGDVLVCGNGESYNLLGLGGETKSKCNLVINPYLKDIVSVVCGDQHTVVMNSYNELFAFGNNCMGQLGTRNCIEVEVPVLIEDPKGVIAYSCGIFHTVILDSSNQVWLFGCANWGLPRECNLKENVNGYKLIEPTGVVVISNGGSHILMKTKQNEIWAFGNNENQQLGLPKPYSSEERITIPTKFPEEYSTIMGTPINIHSRQKSARK